MPDYPLVEFVLSIGTWSIAGEAYPDTGFEGGFSVPIGVGREILADPDVTPVRMADGTLRQVRTWEGTIELDSRRFAVEVMAFGNRYLLGREILDQLEICFEFGQRVTLRFRAQDSGPPTQAT